MILQVMRECRNFFVASSLSGQFQILDSILGTAPGSPDTLCFVPGQYIIISGSNLNDGLYLLSDTLFSLPNTQNETFFATIYGLRPPKDFLALCNNISAFLDSPEGKHSAILRESVLNSHSWARASAKNGLPHGWQTIFAKELEPYRKMFSEVML